MAKKPDDATVQAAVADAIARIKSSAYKGTAIKIELEAQLNRGSDDDHYTTCEDCFGNGTMSCPDDCDEGVVGNTICSTCDGDGYVDCNVCDGDGEVPSGYGDDGCREFILDNVSQEAREALIYSRFYWDGSVDSEFTFTLKIDKAPLAVEFIHAFNKLAEKIGNGMDTQGAGMHIAILNSTDGNYPYGNNLKATYTRNFYRSMMHLLPALYFLASATHKSRGLRYRLPQCTSETKYAAISGRNNVFEYRVFETCYERPEAILDFICVIANTLEFYTRTPKNLDFFGKIGDIGIPDGRGLNRFYYSVKHLEALDRGLEILKPSYKTVDQLKRERSFKVTESTIDLYQKKLEYRARIEYRAKIAQFLREEKKIKQRAERNYDRNSSYIMCTKRQFVEDMLRENDIRSQFSNEDDYVKTRIAQKLRVERTITI